jgi:hypothetical protein
MDEISLDLSQELFAPLTLPQKIEVAEELMKTFKLLFPTTISSKEIC